MVLWPAALLAGLAALIWSADRFVEEAVSAARAWRLSPMLVGMVIIGFGTSAPEIAVSTLASWQGLSGLALGNAYGSNIANVALVLGGSALLRPVTIDPQVRTRELPLLLAVTALAAWQLRDGVVSRPEAAVLLGVFAALMLLALRRTPSSAELSAETEAAKSATDGEGEASEAKVNGWALGFFLLLLVGSSRLLVWGAAGIAHQMGVSDLVIGLTVVALGTSLPELASSLAALRRGEHAMALGNVLGSNLFNTLAVVGLAGAVAPLAAAPEVLQRDLPMAAGMVLALWLCSVLANRLERHTGLALLGCYVGYVVFALRPL